MNHIELFENHAGDRLRDDLDDLDAFARYGKWEDVASLYSDFVRTYHKDDKSKLGLPPEKKRKVLTDFIEKATEEQMKDMAETSDEIGDNVEMRESQIKGDVSSYPVPDSPIKIQAGDKGFATVKKKYRRMLWMHDMDKDGNIKVKKSYGMKNEMKNLKTFERMFEERSYLRFRTKEMSKRAEHALEKAEIETETSEIGQMPVIIYFDGKDVESVKKALRDDNIMASSVYVGEE